MTRRLSDIEAMMWSLELDPNLTSTTGSIAFLNGVPDIERLRSSISAAVVALDPLRERVVSPSIPFAEPYWALDQDFDLDAHLRFASICAPGQEPGTDADVFELATRIVNDPFDRSRPLWQITLVTGLGEERSALVIKAHHSIADGQGLIRLALHVFELTADAPPPDPVDLIGALDELASVGPAADEALTAAIKERIEQAMHLGVSLVETMASPDKLSRFVNDTVAAARVVTGGVVDKPSMSTLWARRSRNRRAIHLDASLAAMKDRATAAGVTVNDLFVVACAEAALGYHRALGVDLDHLAATVVISTRTEDDADDANAFVPCGVTLPGGVATTEDRLRSIRTQVATRRTEVARRQAGLETASQIASFLPAPLVAAAAREQARSVDFATSNLPGPPIPLWLAGCEVASMHPLGPVAGTAANFTLLSFLDTAAVGVHLDPAAVEDAPLFAEELRSAFRRLDLAPDLRTPLQQ